MNFGIIRIDSVIEFGNNAKLVKFNYGLGIIRKLYIMTNNWSFIFNVIITCFHIYLCYHFIFFSVI